MRGAFIATRTEFLIFHASRLLALILGCRIVALFAFGALECYDISHCCVLSTLVSERETGLEPATNSLEGCDSTN